MEGLVVRRGTEHRALTCPAGCIFSLASSQHLRSPVTNIPVRNRLLREHAVGLVQRNLA